MRNHKKVKAIRSKFGVTGYAVWSMILEYLTGNDGNVLEYSDMEFELMSGDFGVSATEIRGVVDYCISLEMLFNVKGFIRSESLDERLAPVYQKRGVAKELSKKQSREHGKFAVNKSDDSVVTVTETPHSKVNRIKLNEIDNDNGFFDSNQKAFEEITGNYIDVDSARNVMRNNGWSGVTDDDVKACLFHFLESQVDVKQQDKADIRSHFRRWLNKQKSEQLKTWTKQINERRQRQSA